MENNQSTPKNLADKELKAVFHKYGLKGGYFLIEDSPQTKEFVHTQNYFLVKGKPKANQLAQILDSLTSMRASIFERLTKAAKDN
jgi:hypothetical protein